MPDLLKSIYYFCLLSVVWNIKIIKGGGGAQIIILVLMVTSILLILEPNSIDQPKILFIIIFEPPFLKQIWDYTTV